jgi:rhodanese-related sulfurtransferase
MKKIITLILISIFVTSSFASALSNENTTEKYIEEEIETSNIGFINISAIEAWDMLSNQCDGLQIPIDMRRLDEYVNERIVSPDDSWIRWFPYELTSDGPGPIKNQGILLKIFMSIYADKEIIIYCRSGRRTGFAAQILIDNGFTGIVYNLVGGINSWKSSGLPTTLN